jgi:hypothetical protein
MTIIMYLYNYLKISKLISFLFEKDLGFCIFIVDFQLV